MVLAIKCRKCAATGQLIEFNGLALCAKCFNGEMESLGDRMSRVRESAA